MKTLLKLKFRFKLFRKRLWFSILYPVRFTESVLWLVRFNTHLKEIEKLTNKIKSFN